MLSRVKDHTQPQRERTVDCVILDLKLPDMSGFNPPRGGKGRSGTERHSHRVPTGRALSADEDAQLRTMARSVVVKGVESPERLLDETALLTPNASVVLRDHFVSGSREVAEVATPRAMHSANARANLE